MHPRKGPKWAFSEQPRTYKERCHYKSYNGSNQDIMSKRRVAARSFGFVRKPPMGSPVYPTSAVVEPFKEAVYYAPEDEQLNKDIDGFIKAQEGRRRARDKEILAAHKADKAYQDYRLFRKREESWERERQREKYLRLKPQGRAFANQSGVNYDIITVQYHLDSYDGRRIKYRDDMAKWRERLRNLYLQSRSTGMPNFNILDWRRIPPPVYPEKPRPAEQDPAAEPQGSKRTLVMEKLRADPDKPAIPVPSDGKLPELLDFSPVPSLPKPDTVRDVIVRQQHPWEQCC